MKLITLNIWGGHVHTPLKEFIASRPDVDIFCLQEVYHGANKMITVEDRKVTLNIFSEIQNLLPNHKGYFRPIVDNIYGIGTFVRKNITLLEEGDYLIHHNPEYPGYGPTHSRILQWLKCKINNEIYVVMNVHGLWNGKGKTDTQERIAQSNRIREFMDSMDARKIVCGDFNLRPDTESLKIIEQNMQNLVDAYQVTSTRTSFYPKAEKFADYIFTSKEITVNHFEVLPEEVSDHAALMVDFD